MDDVRDRPKNQLIEVVGWIDDLGCLRCVECSDGRNNERPVYHGSRPHSEEPCDFCGCDLTKRIDG
jgi:hypothetical protein